MRFIRALGVAADTPTWIVVLIGGIVGVVLMLWLFNWALIVLSSLAGASLVLDCRNRMSGPNVEQL